MSRNKLSKSIHYYRTWQDEQSLNLEKMIKYMLELAPTADDTQIIDNEIVKRIQHRSELKSSEGICLYISHAPKDEHMRTMNNSVRSKNDDGGTIAPPDGQTFVTKEAFIYICTHHFLFCGNGMRVENVVTYFNLLNSELRKQHADLPYLNLTLKPVANCNILKLITEHGVQSITLNASAYELSRLEINEKKSETSFMRKSMDYIANCMKRDKNNNIEDLQVNLSIKILGNSRASVEAREAALKEAQYIIDSNSEDETSEFKIITSNGEVIRHSDVKISKSNVKIDRLEQSNGLLRYDVYQKLQEYYKELKEKKLTES